jgi:hypothetical protein
MDLLGILPFGWCGLHVSEAEGIDHMGPRLRMTQMLSRSLSSSSSPFGRFWLEQEIGGHELCA